MDEAKLQEILDDAAERLALGRYSNADAAVHSLVAEVRRLTAALATVTTERDEAVARAESAESAFADVQVQWRAEMVRLRAEHASALDAARREGAEGMRQRCAGFADVYGMPMLRDAIRTLPLDAPGGGS